MADEYLRVAAMRPTDTNEHQLWVCPAGKMFVGIVSVCNQDSTSHVYSVAHCGAGHGDAMANPADWRGRNVSQPSGPPDEYSVHMMAGETIRIQAGTANMTNFIIEGQLMDVA